MGEILLLVAVLFALVAIAMQLPYLLLGTQRRSTGGREIRYGPTPTPPRHEKPEACPECEAEEGFIDATGHGDPKAHLICLASGCDVWVEWETEGGAADSTPSEGRDP